MRHVLSIKKKKCDDTNGIPIIIFRIKKKKNIFFPLKNDCTYLYIDIYYILYLRRKLRVFLPRTYIVQYRIIYIYYVS